MPRILLADDEPLLRAQLKTCLQALWPEAAIVAEADDGFSALEALHAAQPDIAFLDIRMPGLTGLDVARLAGDAVQIVFVTAYDEYAVAAFEAGAVDYVLKPADAVRLARTVQRLKSRTAAVPGQAAAMADALQPQRTPLRWIQASAGNTLHLIPVEDVLFFQANAKYTRVLTRTQEVCIRLPIKTLAELLDGEQFWQLSRSTLVAANQIAAVQRIELGEMTVHLRDHPEKLSVSQRYQARFRQM
ncbi:two component transcriptional regulator, LytTR family [Andreprevotia lacus DSM 23236]|jgi:DNA-binding LytR/AlgR family response regulator|uniref:Two component transcriptional regulator, LytTR family n=1 Tax=Andreprevotia lacus DSM 23236 TaxID=1121001 RepID=A0A1W1XAM3_9NEIS|nr:LytTR family DNA-binding domain-containing protein [Andreprevotia lacus]SMC20933.1 two component transcriptional regulator, LytTR family [Andreprevotia lacus DSM 23236]